MNVCVWYFQFCICPIRSFFAYTVWGYGWMRSGNSPPCHFDNPPPTVYYVISALFLRMAIKKPASDIRPAANPRHLGKFRMAVSAQRVIRYTSRLVLWVFAVGGSNGAISGYIKSSCRQAAILDNFEWPYLRNGSFDPLMRAVIFAIAVAQLYCFTNQQSPLVWQTTDRRM